MKKKVSLNKKLIVGKTTVANLSTSQQQAIAGGATWTCHTWRPNAGCLTETNQFILCL
ncbi:MAG TPA: class I lanthipeptide [Chitinophaga sp.]|uniref:class I lanthipeptide n=1 Tax=Chitinophaga sp. TaxID=1869181 RepID=UPI002CD73A79|nr:class I lanthipeptide [Chitinophaga sp.]HVI43536.1 class I lanthipeptide [Chitinophaga sp.]